VLYARFLDVLDDEAVHLRGELRDHKNDGVVSKEEWNRKKWERKRTDGSDGMGKGGCCDCFRAGGLCACTQGHQGKFLLIRPHVDILTKIACEGV